MQNYKNIRNPAKNDVIKHKYQTATSPLSHRYKATFKIEVQSLEEDTNAYDLQGRRIATPQKPGVYVRKGRKYVVK